MNTLNNTNLFFNEKFILFVLLILGTVSSVLFYPVAVGYPYQFGEKLIGFFIPPFLSALYLFYCFYLDCLSTGKIVKTLMLFFIQQIPFYSLLIQETSPYPGEDLALNMIYAKNMIENHTLWGGDNIFFNFNGKSFITQPGYRYFVALELLVFKKLYRFVSILNLSAIIIGLYFYLKLISSEISNQKVKTLLATIAFFTVPYATKNVLMGLSEWLAILLLISSVYFVVRKKNIFCSLIFLALVVFMRQNLLPPILLLAIIIISMTNKNRVRNSLVFFSVLMLPLYHNLYYAHEFRFFISIFNYPFLSYTDNSLPASGINFLLLLNNVIHYIGVHFKSDGSFDLIEESIVFLWLFNYSLFYVAKNFFKGSIRLYFLLVMCSVILPTILLATDFYPRFEFVVVYIFLVTVPVLQANTAINKYAECFSLVRNKTV